MDCCLWLPHRANLLICMTIAWRQAWIIWDSLISIGTTSIQWKGVVLSTDILNSIHFQTGQLNWPIYTTNHLFAHQQIHYSCIQHSTRTISSTCWAAWIVNPPVTAELIAANVKQTWLWPHYIPVVIKWLILIVPTLHAFIPNATCISQLKHRSIVDNT